MGNLKDIKVNKVSKSFLKMKDATASAILEKLTLKEAVSIVSSLSAKKVSKIMAKMNPDIASKITSAMIK